MAPKRAPNPPKLPFDIEEVYGEGTRCAGRVHAHERVEGGAAAGRRCVTCSVPRLAGLDTHKPARVRLITDFVLVKDGNFVFPTHELNTKEWWEGVEVYGFMMMPGTDGDAKWFAWTLWWFLSWPGKHFELVRIEGVKNMTLEYSEHWRNGHELVLFLNSRQNFSYAMLEPDDMIVNQWVKITLTSWANAQLNPRPIPLPAAPLQAATPPPWWLRRNGEPGFEATWNRVVRAYNLYHKEARSDSDPEPEPKPKPKRITGTQPRKSLPISEGKGKGKAPASAGKHSTLTKRPRPMDDGSAAPSGSSRPARRSRLRYVEIDSPTPPLPSAKSKSGPGQSAVPPPATEVQEEPASKRPKVMSVGHIAPARSPDTSAHQEGLAAKERMKEADMHCSGVPASTSTAPPTAEPPADTASAPPAVPRPDISASGNLDAEGSTEILSADDPQPGKQGKCHRQLPAEPSQNAQLAGAVRDLSLIPEGKDGGPSETTSPDVISSQRAESDTEEPGDMSQDVMTGSDLPYPLTQPRRRKSPTLSLPEGEGDASMTDAAADQSTRRRDDTQAAEKPAGTLGPSPSPVGGLSGSSEFLGVTPPGSSVASEPPTARASVAAPAGTTSAAFDNSSTQASAARSSRNPNAPVHSVVALSLGARSTQALENRSSSQRSGAQPPQAS
ncbi:hypothetical protein RhiJN_13122 [Ceratobasidium sp. AG-Ba]|nr:hypothetical protein RhiJN_13122 [Ceratobasidium sp. AG-Ba]